MIILPRIFSDNMVLQCNHAIRIWGKATTSEMVDVMINDTFIKKYELNEGHFEIELPAQPMMCQATLSIGEITLRNVDFGEVWIAGGQSNMEFLVQYVSDEYSQADLCDSHIRMYTVGQYSFEGERELGYKKNQPWDQWQESSPENAKTFSAVGFFFAKELRKKGVPVGIINMSWGGTTASTWISKEKLAASDALKVYLKDFDARCAKINMPVYAPWKEGIRASFGSKEQQEGLAQVMRNTFLPEVFAARGMPFPALPEGITTGDVDIEKLMTWGPGDQNEPGALYRSMVQEIAGYTAKGFLWYQGESDDEYADLYEELLSALITSYREIWKAELPFIVAELAPFGTWGATSGKYYPILREAQKRVAQNLNQVYLISNGDGGNIFDIHPKYKKPVGQRAAWIALEQVYHEKLQGCAPSVSELQLKDNNILLRVNYGEGLHRIALEEGFYNGFALKDIPKEYLPPVLDGINGLEVYVDDALITEADVVISDGEIVIHLKERVEGRKVRVCYGQTAFYRLNICNAMGVPVLPFSLATFS